MRDSFEGAKHLVSEASLEADKKAFERFTTGTPATDTDGQPVMVLSDSFAPESKKYRALGRETFSPDETPFADTIGTDGQTKIRVFKTNDPRVYYREFTYKGKTRTGYIRPYDPSIFEQEYISRSPQNTP